MNLRPFILGAAASALLLCPTAGLAGNDTPPAPVGPLPTPAQVKWQQMETYAFIHFGPNTFLDREWGYGDAPLSSFNPTRLDCEQWARTVKAAGMKGIILTAKHHDGFCLWPTKYTDYSVRNTPFRDGKGDVVGELAAACKKYGLKLGLYLSPWDRHQAFYGTPLYVEYFHAQLEELISNYGDLFEIWFDGANGGDGWYGGAKETRTIDRRKYYDYPRAWKEVAEKQPDAQIFSDGGPGCRWVGNEQGWANATNWSLLRAEEVYAGYSKSWELTSGHADGTKWVPAECNVSIRPGWFYHESQDDKVKTVDQLVDLWYRSVGHNGTQNINLPIDRDGLVYPTDSARLIQAHQRVVAELKTDLMPAAKIKADNTRGKAFSVKNLTDDNFDTYWATDDGKPTGTLTVTFGKPTRLNRLMLGEYIPLGQRVRAFSVEWLDGKAWKPLNCGEETTTIGYKRILRFKPIQTRQLRIRFTDSRGPLCINRLSAYYAPKAHDNFVEKATDIKGLKFTVAAQADDAVTLDLGTTQNVRALYYLPPQNQTGTGVATHYEILAGDDPAHLTRVAEGEFSNIRNSPILQEVYFTPAHARYVQLKATRMANSGDKLGYKEIAVK